MAEVVRVTRTDRGLTMRGLARAAGVDVGYVSRIENAAYDLPNPLYLQAISDALGISATVLLLATGYLRERDLASSGDTGHASETQI